MTRKAIVALMFLALVVAGQNQQASASFPEKDITFVIPYSPGGGFDTYVRAIAPVMEKYLPNSVNVVPKNMPGAGGRKGGNFVDRAKPDGYTIGIYNFPGIVLAQIKGKAKFDLKKVVWLAQIATDKYGFAVRGNSNLRSIQDLRNARSPIKFTSTGKSTTAHVVAVIATNSLGIPTKLITGYKGSKNSILGAIRGDGDAIVMVLGTLEKYVRSGDLRMVATLTENTPFPGVPNAGALGKPGLANLGIARLVGATPGIPTEAERVLAQALFRALNDPGLRAWSKKARRSILPRDAAGAENEVRKQFQFFEKYQHLF